MDLKVPSIVVDRVFIALKDRPRARLPNSTLLAQLAHHSLDLLVPSYRLYNLARYKSISIIIIGVALFLLLF